MSYIKIDRKIQDNFVWKDKPFSRGQAWIDLLLLARWQDGEQIHRGKIYNRKRGEVCCSMRWLAEKWGWSRGKVERFINGLETEQMVSIKRAPHDTTIFIENYSKYQPTKTVGRATNEPQTEPQTSHKRTHNNKDNKNNKDNNINNINNKLNIDLINNIDKNPPISPLMAIVDELPKELQSTVKEFITHRQEIDKRTPFTERALRMMLKKLNELSGDDTKTAIAILEQSMANGWKGIFPVDKSAKGEKPKDTDEMLNGIFNKAYAGIEYNKLDKEQKTLVSKTDYDEVLTLGVVERIEKREKIIKTWRTKT